MAVSRKRIFQITLLFCALLVGFLFCEAISRVFLKMSSRTLAKSRQRPRVPNGGEFQLYDLISLSDNPRLMYELIPNRKGTFLGAPYHSNSHGLRGKEITVRKPENTWRIAALGDSTMFGWGAADSQSYPAVLERALNSIGDKHRYQVLNFSIPGYNTAMETEQFLTKATAFSPDLILMQFDINDLALPNFVVDAPKLLALNRSYFLSLLKGILVERNAAATLKRLASPTLSEAKKGQFQTKSGLKEYWEYRAERTPREFRYMVGWDGVIRAVDRLWGRTSQPVLHLSMPYPISEQDLIQVSDDALAQHIQEAAKENKPGKRPICYEDISHYADEFAKDLGIKPRVDLVFKYPDDLHPSSEGYILIARSVYLSLVKNHLLPEDSLHYQKSNEVAQSLWNEARRRYLKRTGKAPVPAQRASAPKAQ